MCSTELLLALSLGPLSGGICTHCSRMRQPFRKNVRKSTNLDSGASSMELRVLEHPPQLWHNSQLSTSVTNIVSDNR